MTDKRQKEQADLHAMGLIMDLARGTIQFRLEQPITGGVYAKFFDCSARVVYGAYGATFAEAVEKAVAAYQERD